MRARIVDYPRIAKKGWRRFIPSWRLVLASNVLAAAFGILAFAYVYASVTPPDPNELVQANASIVYWSDGKTEMGRFNVGEGNRRTVPLRQVPKSLQNAVLAAEDRSFYSNNGFSIKGVGRAVVTKVKGGSTQGGSTITQQYVKNYFLTQDQTVKRKVKELVISLKVEQSQSKDSILENYLNTIYFGRRANGVQTASQAYFGIPVEKLNTSQSALIAAIIRSPSLYDPIEDRERTEARWNYVLNGMVEEGWLSPEDRAKQKYPKVIAPKVTNRFGGTTGYLMLAVQREVKARTKLSENEIDRAGLRIVTTFEKNAQEAAVTAVAEKMPTENDEGVRVGLAAVRPRTGEIIAMYGGPDALKQPYDAASQGSMQAGSTFKPFALAAALREGKSLKSVYNGNSPQYFNGGKVSNTNDQSFGNINLVKATESSVNTVYVALNADIGPEKTQQSAIDAGYPEGTLGLENPNPNSVLGTASPRVIDVAGAYATFAAQGERADNHMVKKVVDLKGKVIWEAQLNRRRVYTRDIAADVTYALERVNTIGTGDATKAIGRVSAGKTGTTQENKSAWFVGYTPQLATAVGMYRETKGKPASLNGLGGRSQVYGSTFAVYIWNEFMQAALSGMDEEKFPEPAYGGESNIRSEVPRATPEPTADPSVTVRPTEVRPTGPIVPSPRNTPRNSLPPTLPTGTRPGTPTPDPTRPGPTGRPTPTETVTPTPTRTKPGGNGNAGLNQRLSGG